MIGKKLYHNIKSHYQDIMTSFYNCKLEKKHSLIINFHEIDLDKNDIFSYEFSKFQDLINKFLDLDLSIGDAYSAIRGDVNIGITFDDAYASSSKAIEWLLKKNITSSISVITCKTAPSFKEYLNLSDLKEFCKNGVEIISHSINHYNFTRIDSKQRKIELCESKQILENEIKKNILGFSIPYGKYNNSLPLEAKEAGYKYVLTSNYGSFQSNFKKFCYPRVAVLHYDTSRSVMFKASVK